MIALFKKLSNSRVSALFRKELNQIRRDRRLALSLVIPPLLQLTLFGFALSARVENVPLGVVDESKSKESRDLIAVLTESKSFQLAGYFFSVDQLGEAISHGTVNAGIVIPNDFARDLQRDRSTTVQFLLNATNANSAAISQGYAEAVIQNYNARLRIEGAQGNFRNVSIAGPNRAGQASLHPAFLYNPGLKDSWFITTGVLGLLLILNSSIVASGAMVKEREAGTIEQLLMSPAGTGEIIIAKIAPLFLLLSLMMFLALIAISTVFGVPFHGGLLPILGGGALCVLAGIGIGTSIATFSKSAQQALLTSFFINPPLVSLSGALNPVEAMPAWLQPLTVINPIHHFATIARGSMLKGSGIDALWPNFMALSIITVVLLSLSVWRFRKQLS
ncbi:MAG TPA: ABC transporter permease [Pyrinomonadaceae bacterium]|nr:ABC transporter permease [Pyrinomonadaceae bacterium]